MGAGNKENYKQYEERDGIFYPVIVAGTEKADIDAGKYGRMWIKYIKEEYPMRYKSLVRFGELEERANEVNETAYELLDDIEAKWLKKHKPIKNSLRCHRYCPFDIQMSLQH